MVGCRNPGGTGIRQHLAIEILPAPESSDIQQLSPADQIPAETSRNSVMVRSWQDLAGIQPDLTESSRIWMDSATDLAGSGKNGWDPVGFGWIQPQIRPDLAKMAGILPDLTGSGGVRPESGNFDRIQPNMLAGIQQRRSDITGFRRQLHFHIS